MKGMIFVAMCLMSLACAKTSTTTGGGEPPVQEPAEQSEVSQIGDLKIQYATGQMRSPWHNVGGGKHVDDKQRMSIQFRITNESKSKSYDFTGWCYGNHTPSVRDDLGSESKAVSYPPLKGNERIWAGDGVQVHQKTVVEPGKTLWMAVPFDAPAEKAKTLIVDLPAEAFGMTGKFRVKVDLAKMSRTPERPGWTMSRAPRTSN